MNNPLAKKSTEEVRQIAHNKYHADKMIDDDAMEVMDIIQWAARQELEARRSPIGKEGREALYIPHLHNA